MPAVQKRLLGLLGFCGLLAIWQGAVNFGLVRVQFASSPARVASVGWDLLRGGQLLEAGVSTARLFALGYGISLVLGLSLGVALGWFRRVGATFNPWVSTLYAAPRIAFIPLIVVWAGTGLRAQVVVVVINAMFPILVSTAAGIDAIDRQHLKVAQSFGASSWAVLRKIALPGAMPTLFAGIRIGMMTALLGTVVAEYFVGLTGIGGMIFVAGLTLNTTTALVGAVVFSIAALFLNSLLGRLQARVDRWR